MVKKRKRVGSRANGQTKSNVLTTVRSFLSALPAPEQERFLPERLLGSGGIGEVYSALDLRRVEWGDADPKVAIKRLKPEYAENVQARLALAQEFCVLRHLIHPGVVRVFDLHKEPYGICFSMELLKGHTVQDALLEQPAGLVNARAIGTCLFETLHYLHSHGVVHGDVKPSNIFLGSNARVVLFDFNVATATAKAGAATSPITRGLRESLKLPSFSMRYASPERLSGGEPSAADDIFAACCTVYEAASGAHPFGRLTALQAQAKNIRPEQLVGLTQRQWQSLHSGMAFDSSKRPQADALLRELSRSSMLGGLQHRLHWVFN